MSFFSKIITDFGFSSLLSNGNVLYRDDVFTLVTNKDLKEESRVKVLETSDHRVMAVLTPQLAEKAGLYHQDKMSESIFRQKLKEADIILYDADYVFYFSDTEKMY
ncbi:hypothetical protein [Xenorhabdus szentirmaii]|uniref:hypothetical protein n=1 Tax=Xenorhabdus szentirmaii TaxID=290112 RepID=UPI002B40C223|nr:hypothetical protein [Xenorhabdus sp. 42]